MDADKARGLAHYLTDALVFASRGDWQRARTVFTLVWELLEVPCPTCGRTYRREG